MYDEQKDEAFFAGKRNLLTAKWEEPFSYESIRSKHAPVSYTHLDVYKRQTIDCAASMARYLLLQKKDYHYAGGGEEAYLDRV